MSDEPPFKKGDRVRMKFDKRNLSPQMKSYQGTVTRILGHGPSENRSWTVDVRRDGLSRFTTHYFWFEHGRPCDWELIPFGELGRDDVALMLAKAVLAGDMSAAGPLADRVSELMQG